MARVLLQNVSKAYPGVAQLAVDSATIEARDGEFLVLVGPSGCGKSTSLRMVAGLEEATSGDIFIGERCVNYVAPKDRDIAMIFQNYALYPHMSVYENMAFPLRMRKFPKTEIDRRVRETAATLGLTEYLNRKPKALSGGQRQRVAVGRAIVREPAVFLFDEPLSNLDAKMRVTMRNEIRALHRRLKTTMIYVTHDQVEAMTMGDRIVVMHAGKVQQIDEPGTIYARPRNMFVAGFIGSPPMNFIRGRLAGEGGALRFEGGDFKFDIPADRAAGLESAAGSEVVLGLRPEDFSDAAGGPGMAFEAEIENREPLGAELILYFKTAGGPVVARLAGDASGAIGERKRLAVNLSRAHFFDAKTEERIG